MTNRQKTVLYIGVTSNLKKRIWEHRSHYYPSSFTDRYNVEYLIYYEVFNSIMEAILREKQLKKWSRKKKEHLISIKNKEWRDLYNEVMNDIYSLL